MIGVTGYGAYIPRLRMQRRAIVDANAWYAPSLAGKAKGAKALANWDEDSITHGGRRGPRLPGPG